MENSKIAEYLLKIKAVSLKPDQPFQWSSGWLSPIYCDNRISLSYPEVRSFIRDAFVAKIQELYPEAEAIAGVATGAIAWAALVADVMDLPMVYVRPKPKGHGMQNLIEGAVEVEKRYVVVEDLVSTGGSSAKAVRALQAAGVQVLGTVAVFSYGFPQSLVAFEETQTEYHSLTNLTELLQKAIENNYLQSDALASIHAWQQAPESWKSA